MLRSIILLAAALALPAAAQTTFTPGSPAQQVQLLAPQLVAFSGSAGNFDSLVSGLSTGTPVTLAAANSDGSLQLVSFTPGTVLSIADTARLLETARQNLLARGIATPTGPQLAAALLGGTISAPSGTSLLTGVLSGSSTPPTPIAVRTEPGALQAPAPSNLATAQLQALRNALVSGTGLTLTTGTGSATQNVTFTPNGRLTEAQASQALQSASALLAQQGVLDPTAEQLRAALFGGTVLAANGTPFLVQGVLQPELRNTSDSRIFNTSASPANAPRNGPAVAPAAPASASTTAGPVSRR